MKNLIAIALLCFTLPAFAQDVNSPFKPVDDTHRTTPAIEAPTQDSVQDTVYTEAATGTFHAELLSAVTNARKAGSITRGQALRIRIRLLAPAFRQHCKELAMTQMFYSGDDGVPMNADGTINETAIDWEGLAAFLEKMIPLILQLIEIFG